METKCSYHTHIKTFQPPIALINLQPPCSAFSPLIKPPHILNNTPKVSMYPLELQTFIYQISPHLILESGKHLIYLKLNHLIENLKKL